MTKTEEAIRQLFKGVRRDNEAVKVSFTHDSDKSTTVSLTTSVPGGSPILLDFPADWHEHELELHGSGNAQGTIRWCKKCGHTCVLKMGDKGLEWHEVSEPAQR